MSQKYFPELDGLRAVAIALVIYTHVPSLLSSDSILRHLQGWVGVDIFFVLSGFLITTLLLDEERRLGRVDLRAFYVRRFFRIVPLYLLLLGFYVVQASFNDLRWKQMAHALPYQLTFMNDVLASHIDKTGDFTGVNRIPFGASWSLGIEEKFYFAWPLLFFWLLAQWRRRYLFLGVLFPFVALLPFRMFRSYFALLMGCGLAIAISGDFITTMRVILHRIPISVILGSTVASLYLIDFDQRWIFVFSLSMTLLVGSIATCNSWLAKLMRHPYLVWIGKRSYSMYLIQAICISMVGYVLHQPRTEMQAIEFTIVAVALSSLGANLLFCYIENPMRLFGKRLILARQRVNPPPEGIGRLGQSPDAT